MPTPPKLFVTGSTGRLGRLVVDDRDIESLTMLFLVLVLSSVALIPTCTYPSFGIAAITLGALALATVVPIQQGYMRHTDVAYRRTSRRVAWFSRSAPIIIIIGGTLLASRNGNSSRPASC